MVITLLAASCIGNNAVEPVQTENATEEALPDLGKFVAVVTKSSNADYTAGNEIAKQKIIDSIAQDKGVKIDFEIIELSKENFTNELNQLLASGTIVDSITVDYDMLDTYASLPGLLKPIDSLLSSYGSNLYAAIDESYWEESKYNGEIYGIPSMPYPEQSVMMTRGDMLYMFTAEPVTSYSSLLGVCKFYKNAGYEYPLAITWDQLIDVLALSFNVSPAPYTHTDKSNAFIMREQASGYIENMIDEVKVMYEEGFINPNLFTATEDQMKAEFMAGRSAIYITEYGDIYADRDMLKSTFPDSEMKLITPLVSRWNKKITLSGEEKIDNILMFTANGTNNEALMTFLDWSYASQLNHTMLELGAYGQQLMYNPALSEYNYTGDYSLENKPYDGLFTLGLATDMLYKAPTYVEYTNDIMAINTLQKDVQAYLGDSNYQFSVTVPLNDAAKIALEQYTNIMRTGAEKYITGEISIDEYAQYERDCRNSGLLSTLAQEIGVSYLYEIGVLN